MCWSTGKNQTMRNVSLSNYLPAAPYVVCGSVMGPETAFWPHISCTKIRNIVVWHLSIIRRLESCERQYKLGSSGISNAYGGGDGHFNGLWVATKCLFRNKYPLNCRKIHRARSSAAKWMTSEPCTELEVAQRSNSKCYCLEGFMPNTKLTL